MELSTEIDWVIKKALIEGFMERKGWTGGTPRCRCSTCSTTTPAPTRGSTTCSNGRDAWRASSATKRSRPRSTILPRTRVPIFAANACGAFPAEVFGVNWDSISFGVGDEPVKRVMMSEPLKGTKDHVEELLRTSESAGDLVKNLRA